MTIPPALATLRAFGLPDQLVLERLPGGRGLCYRAGTTVLRPADDPVEAQWLCRLSATLLARSPTAYRLAAPIPAVSSPDTFVVDGWTASTFLPGRISVHHFADIFRAARALHADLADLVSERPAEVTSRAFNRFDEADRVTWGEKTLGAVDKVNRDLLTQLQPILDRLESAMRRLPTDDAELCPQLVHMDLLGNVLIQEGEPPGIIDLTLYWRPMLYAEAVVVADGLVRLGDLGPKLLDYYLRDDSRSQGGNHVRVQLLIRALYWRYITFAIDPDLDWVGIHLPNADFAGAAGVICSLSRE